MRDDEIGTLARNRLASELGTLVRAGLVDTVEGQAHRLFDKVGYWPEAKNSLRILLSYHTQGLDDETIRRVEGLKEAMNPKELRGSILAFTSAAQGLHGQNQR